MKKGYLSQYFDGIAIKRLSAVESNILVSNQHEFNGVKGLQKILGTPTGRIEYPAQFLFLNDFEDDLIFEDSFLTWYDAREKARVERGVMRSEYRLYFPDNRAIQYANTNDILIIAKKSDNTLLAIIAENETTIASQILWLFGINDLELPGFHIREELESEKDRIEFASRKILENIGIKIESDEESFYDEMLGEFGLYFPTTRIFSNFARSTLEDLSPLDDPDIALILYMEREEILFKTMEKHIIEERLTEGFHGDVDGFLSFSLSVQNRRKSRAGLALENHLEYIFDIFDLKFKRTVATENKSKPDFLFPGIEEYRDTNFPSQDLTMLGVKSSCKDRWRQVLAEAERIEQKHLLTLEAAISKNQTDEMKAKKLQLVLPQKIHESYNQEQKEWLMNISSFLGLVKDRQR